MSATSVVRQHSRLDMLAEALSPLGVVSIETDEDWASRQNPTIVSGPRPLSFGEMDYHFWPVMLRWRFADGQRRLAWLPPEIRRDANDRPRLDYAAMERRFVDIIRSSAVPT